VVKAIRAMRFPSPLEVQVEFADGTQFSGSGLFAQRWRAMVEVLVDYETRGKFNEDLPVLLGRALRGEAVR